MKAVDTIKSLRQIIKNYRQAEETVALVPTMGNLHNGHLSLVRAAQAKADRVVVSLFVNPTQFGEGEDYAEYPRTEEQDRELLSGIGTDLLFMPDQAEVYNANAETTVMVNRLTGLYCGASRPGHFTGVATIVCKLFNMVQPDLAVFGEKDWQQLVIIRRMVEDLNIPVEIRSAPIVRESSGLAMSSRNGYLSEAEKAVATGLYQALCQARDEVLAGQKSLAEIEQRQIRQLDQSGFVTDYFSICRSDDLQSPGPDDDQLVILTAARLGKTRLIDNIHLSRKH